MTRQVHDYRCIHSIIYILAQYVPTVSAYRHNTRGRHTTHLEKLTINNRLTSDLKSVELVYRYEYMYARIRSVFDGACLISCSTVYTSDRSSAPRRTRSYCGQCAILSTRLGHRYRTQQTCLHELECTYVPRLNTNMLDHADDMDRSGHKGLDHADQIL